MKKADKNGMLDNQVSRFFLTIAFPGSKQVFLIISFANEVIDGIEFSSESALASKRNVFTNSFTKKVQTEFDAYFSNPDYLFSLTCNLQQGTAFQQRVWQALTEIPAGQVKTYGTLAQELNSSPRAVGNACRNNPFPLLVPCHRVVSASGIGGYAGDTLTTQKGKINYLQIKQWLLMHEKAKTE